jgi:ABC-type multidrug transport system ATPase subunit/pSer/pThr/pTyr-binding forkhead associated (FHA) protein
LGTQRIAPSSLIIRIIGQPDQEKVLTGVEVTIGRERDNVIPVPFPDVSRHHARILPHNGGYAVEDLDSANGTHLRGKRIPARHPVPLSHNDVVRVGDQSGNSISITYRGPEAAAVSGSLRGQVDLSQSQLGNLARFSIGRDPQSNLVINTPIVSWHHAEVLRNANGHQLVDLNSTNGTFVNGRRIRSVQLKPGDEVQIGPYKLRYSSSGFQQESHVGNVRLDGVLLRREVPAKQGVKVILNDVSITVMPREFVALVGGSGAGKSTLMDALNGFRRVNSGRVLLNGDDLYQNFDAYRSSMGYVPQTDILHTSLPVHRTLRYIAMLRLPPDTSMDSINQRTEAALQQVEMLPQLNQSIQSLSGGQRKRVSIAAELLSDPSLFFLDEPTSGLDPGLDKKMMSTLRLLADSGRTILLTTHATNNIRGQCDHVAFLSHGRLVYFGPPDQAIKFFTVTDFADIYSKLESPQEAQKWEDSFKGTQEYKNYVSNRQRDMNAMLQRAQAARRRTNRLAPLAVIRQFGILSLRYLDLIFKDYMSMFILLAVMPIIGFLLLMIANAKSLVGDTPEKIDQIIAGKGFYNIVGDTQKLLLMMALSVILLGVFAASYEIIKEKPIYQRERMVNLRIGPYLFSKYFILLGFGLLQCLMLMLVVGIKVDYPQQGIFLPAIIEIYISLVLALAVGLAMGLFISAVVKNSNMVIYLVLVVLFIQIIFSGVLFNLPGIAGSLSYVTPTRWAMEGLGSIANMERLNELSVTYIEYPINEKIPSTVDFTIDYDFTVSHLFETWLLQAIFIVIFLALTFIRIKTQDV